MCNEIVIAAAVALAVPAAAATPPVPVLHVDGSVPRPLALDAAGFASLPHTKMTATIHGALLTCTGVALIDLLTAAGVPSGDAVRGAALTTAIVARASDGYRVVFSLGELDRALGRAQVMVADRCNDAALPDGDGPWRLIAAGDTRGARSVKAVDQINVVTVR